MKLTAYLPEFVQLFELGSNGWNPNVDLLEHEDEWLVVMEVPGLSREDIKIHFEDGLLTLSGQKKSDSDHGLWLRESTTGSFCRSFNFAEDVDPEMIKAELKDGVLKVRVPKREQAKPKEIKVN
jgi:HSP20 family protein